MSDPSEPTSTDQASIDRNRSGGRPIRVVIVDDQPLIRAGFSMILAAEESIELVAEASNGREALEAARTHRPDVVLMDIRMPVMNGIEATRELKELCIETAVLVLTTFDNDENVYAALRAGASGFLLKDTQPDELVNAIEVVAAGQSLLSPTVTKRLITTFANMPDELQPDPGMTELTQRENDVLLLIAAGMSNAEIAAQLFVGETTVKTHVGHILTKLDVRDRLQAVITAYETGLIRPGQNRQSGTTA